MLRATITNVNQVYPKLPGTSEGFQAAIVDEAKVLTTQSTCPAGMQIDITYYWPDYLASGGTGACGGARAVWWLDKQGHWQRFDYQDSPPCSDLRKAGVQYAIPYEADLKCIDARKQLVLYKP